MNFEQQKERLLKITEDNVKDRFLNAVTNENLGRLIEIYRDLTSILETMDIHQHPGWIQTTMANYIKNFFNVYDKRSKDTEVKDLWYSMYLHRGGGQATSFYFPSIPIIQGWFGKNAINFERTDAGLNVLIDDKIKTGIQDITEDFNHTKGVLDETLTQASNILKKLQEASGKIAVKEYAEVFENQAESHSNHSGFTLKSTGWIVSGISISLAFIVIIYYLDIFLPFNGEKWNPQNISHLLGRTLLVSTIIYLISFCFKQYRINKHLYTINKHRANTLKSFEYLTNAINDNDRSSYNAILMKVAESIYEAGYTGYVNSSDKNTDAPTIIDMAKIVSGGGKSGD